MKTSKHEFKKNLGFAGAAGAVGALAMASAKAQTDEIKAGPTNSSVFNVKDFGAFGDGVTPDSEAIQKALDAAGEVQGTVYFPSESATAYDGYVGTPVGVRRRCRRDARTGQRGSRLRIECHGSVRGTHKRAFSIWEARM